jgi:hypothetical protein
MRIGPGNTEKGYWVEQNEKLDEIISEASQRRAVERVREALEKVEAAQIKWKAIVQTRTPSAGRINLVPNRWQLTVNTRRWHPQVERDLRQHISRSGVQVIAPVGGPFVPFPTDNPNDLVEFYYNYPAFPFPIAIWDLGTITVQGSQDAILNHIRSWSRIPGYIASVRGLSITGTGNRLRATYNLIVLAYVNTENVSGGSAEGGRVPDISSSAAGAGGAQGQGSGTMSRPGGTGPAGGGGGGGAPGAAGGGSSAGSAS